MSAQAFSHTYISYTTSFYESADRSDTDRYGFKRTHTHSQEKVIGPEINVVHEILKTHIHTHTHTHTHASCFHFHIIAKGKGGGSALSIA